MRRASTKTWMAILLTAGVAVLTGCDDDDEDITDPPPTGAEGEVSAVVMDDAAEPENGEAGTFTGTLTGDARVEIQAEGETEFTGLGDDEEITVTLQSTEGDETTISAVTTADVSGYTALRLILTDAQVDLEAGSVVEDTTLEEAATITVGAEAEGGEVVIEEDVTFEVTEDAATTFTFDLNSADWMTRAALDAGDIEETAVQSAATVTVNGGAS